MKLKREVREEVVKVRIGNNLFVGLAATYKGNTNTFAPTWPSGIECSRFTLPFDFGYMFYDASTVQMLH